MKHCKKGFLRIPEEKQELIIEAALQEFSSSGFKAANINTIASNASISIGSMYSYFCSKEDLFLLIVDRGYELLQRALEEVLAVQGSVFEKYRRMLQVSIDYSRTYPRFNQIYLELSTEGLSHLATELSQTVESITARTYRVLLRMAVEAGELRDDIDLDSLAFCLDNIAMSLQFAHSSRYYRERLRLFVPNIETLSDEQLIDRILDIFTKGVALSQ